MGIFYLKQERQVVRAGVFPQQTPDSEGGEGLIEGGAL